jgi:IclR family transcriptional regulator, acetate operon repressor
LKHQLARTRKVGLGTNFEETEQGVCGVGVAIRVSVDRTVTAFTVAMPSVRFRRSDIPKYTDALHAAALLAAHLLRDAVGAGQDV